MRILIHWIVSALAILVTAYLLPGVAIDGFTAALIVAIVLGLINAVLRPLLMFLTLPINILTLGLFVFVINGLLVMLAASIVPGFAVDGLLSGILFAIIVAIVHAVLGMFEGDKKEPSASV